MQGWEGKFPLRVSNFARRQKLTKGFENSHKELKLTQGIENKLTQGIENAHKDLKLTQADKLTQGIENSHKDLKLTQADKLTQGLETLTSFRNSQ